MHDWKTGQPTIRPSLTTRARPVCRAAASSKSQKRPSSTVHPAFSSGQILGSEHCMQRLRDCSGAQFISAKFIAYSGYLLLTAPYLKAVRITEYRLVYIRLSSDEKCRGGAGALVLPRPRPSPRADCARNTANSYHSANAKRKIFLHSWRHGAARTDVRRKRLSLEGAGLRAVRAVHTQAGSPGIAA